MAQAEETRCLSKEQIKTTMNNYAKVNKIKDIKKAPYLAKKSVAKNDIEIKRTWT